MIAYTTTYFDAAQISKELISSDPAYRAVHPTMLCGSAGVFKRDNRSQIPSPSEPENNSSKISSKATESAIKEIP
jgi:hypothetical protein